MANFCVSRSAPRGYACCTANKEFNALDVDGSDDLNLDEVLGFFTDIQREAGERKDEL